MELEDVHEVGGAGGQARVNIPMRGHIRDIPFLLGLRGSGGY